MSIRINDPGVLTTVQDQGRIGYQAVGVSVSGCADGYSARIANILLSNDENEAVLECTILGPKILFETANVIAITGGNLRPMVDGREVPMYRAVRVKEGQVLSFRGIWTGIRSYIAFAGGLDIPEVMGSRSTYTKAKLGGLEGRKLLGGDVIKFRHPQAELPHMERRVIHKNFYLLVEYRLRVVLGPQDDHFTEAGLKTFLNSTYTLSPSHDRMGLRLDGPAIEAKDGYDIISDGIAMGAVEVAGGKPIILLSDRQTTGGYPKIANVISADFRVLGQLKAGAKLKFEAISVEAAQTELLAQRGFLRGIRQAIEMV